MNEGEEIVKTDYFSGYDGKHAVIRSGNSVIKIAPFEDHLGVMLAKIGKDGTPTFVGEPLELKNPLDEAEKIAEIIEGKIREGKTPEKIFEDMKKVDATREEKDALGRQELINLFLGKKKIP